MMVGESKVHAEQRAWREQRHGDRKQHQAFQAVCHATWLDCTLQGEAGGETWELDRPARCIGKGTWKSS